jgi:predicted esterase
MMERAGITMEQRYVDALRSRAERGPLHGKKPGCDRISIMATGKHENTLIFFHGFKMAAKEMLDTFVDLSKLLPTWKFVLPQAPELAITAHGGTVSNSWYDYLTDHDGAKEDTVDIFGLRKVKTELQKLVAAENALLPPGTLSTLGGLSQGGTLALHLATHLDATAVVTVVACRLSQSMVRPLRCPWHAILAGNDEVYHRSWAKSLMTGVSTTKTVDDNHYLEKTDIPPLLHAILCDLPKGA